MTRWQRMTFTLDKSQKAILIFTAAALGAIGFLSFAATHSWAVLAIDTVKAIIIQEDA